MTPKPLPSSISPSLWSTALISLRGGVGASRSRSYADESWVVGDLVRMRWRCKLEPTSSRGVLGSYKWSSGLRWWVWFFIPWSDITYKEHTHIIDLVLFKIACIVVIHICISQTIKDVSGVIASKIIFKKMSTSILNGGYILDLKLVRAYGTSKVRLRISIQTSLV